MKKYLKSALLLLGLLFFLRDLSSMNNNNNLKNVSTAFLSNNNNVYVLQAMGIFLPPNEDFEMVLEVIFSGVFSLEYLQWQYRYCSNAISNFELSTREDPLLFFKEYNNYVNFLNKQKCCKISDLYEFCRVIKVINFSLNLLLNNTFVRELFPRMKLNLASCLIQYWNIIAQEVERVFEIENVDESFLRDSLSMSCEFLVNGLSQWVKSFSAKDTYVSERDLWKIFYILFFKAMRPMSNNSSLIARNIDQKRMVKASMACIPKHCLYLLFSSSSMHQSMKRVYHDILLKKIIQQGQTVKCSINNAIELQRILEMFEREVTDLHDFFASAL